MTIVLDDLGRRLDFVYFVEDTHFLSHTISISDGLKQPSSATHFGTGGLGCKTNPHKTGEIVTEKWAKVGFLFILQKKDAIPTSEDSVAGRQLDQLLTSIVGG